MRHKTFAIIVFCIALLGGTAVQWAAAQAPGYSPDAECDILTRVLQKVCYPEDHIFNCGCQPGTECLVSDCDLCCLTRWDRWWMDLDYLHWWVEGYAVPPLVTASAPGGGGTLTDPGVTVQFGDNRVDTEGRSGLRSRLGYWFDDEQSFGIQAEFLGLVPNSTNYTAVSNANRWVWRPFFNTDPGAFGPDAQLADRIAVTTTNEVFSAEADLRKHLWCCYNPVAECGYRFDLLAGYRFFQLSEGLTVRERASFPPSTVFHLADRFATDNRFNGVNLGLAGEWFRGDWTFEMLAKFALGNSHQEITVNGGATTTVASLPSTSRVGGLLTQTTNSGHFSDDRFAILPEFGAEVGYKFSQKLRVTAGYNLLVLTQVVRPGDQIDLSADGRFLNPNIPPPFIPPATRPARRFSPSNVVIQGMNVGLEFRY